MMSNSPKPHPHHPTTALCGPSHPSVACGVPPHCSVSCCGTQSPDFLLLWCSLSCCGTRPPVASCFSAWHLLPSPVVALGIFYRHLLWHLAYCGITWRLRCCPLCHSTSCRPPTTTVSVHAIAHCLILLSAASLDAPIMGLYPLEISPRVLGLAV